MKTLVLVRHAKSSWNHDVSDEKRPLKSRGIRDAKAVSKNFKALNFQPDIVISSPAKRALTTCKIFLKNLNIEEEKLNIENNFYDFGGQNVINFLKSLDDNYQNVMIFGHNHAFTSISNIFGNKYIDNLPTSGLVMIDFNCDKWQDIEAGETQLIIFPKDLRE